MASNLESFKKGKTVINQNDEMLFFGIIFEGELCFNGNNELTLKCGDCLGQETLISDGDHYAEFTINCVEDTKIFVIYHHEFLVCFIFIF